MNNDKYCRGVHQQLQGFYKLAILDGQTDELIWEQADWGKNLILNQGLDHIYDDKITQCFTYGIRGTGTRVNSISSGTTTATVVGTALSLDMPLGSFTDFTGTSGGHTPACAAGDMIKFSNGVEVRVVSVTGATTATITPSSGVTALAFNIWKTSQTELHIEDDRSSTLVTGHLYASSSFSASTVEHRRSWDWPVEVSDVNYIEMGVGWAAAGNPSTVFSRWKLDDLVYVNTGQKLRLIYKLKVSFYPDSASYFTAVVSGWAGDTTAFQAIKQFSGSIGGTTKYFVSTITSSGVTFSNSFPLLEPVDAGAGYFLATASHAIEQFGSASNRYLASYATTTVAREVYTPLNFYCNKTVTYTQGSYIHSDIRSMGFGSGSGAASGSNQAFLIVLNANQTKTATQELNLAYRWTWGRTLA